jgi:tetratricopeptide (TPR) repeat protein
VSEVDEAQALLARARALAASGRYGDAVALFDALVERFGDSADPALDAEVGEALFSKALSLQQIEREQQAVEVYEQMAARYRDRPDFHGHLSRALVQGATALGRLDRLDEAVDTWDELLESFRDVSEPPLAVGVALAYLGKAGALRRLDRVEEAISSYDELIVRFSDSPFPVLRGRVDAALSEKVFVLLLQRRWDEAIVVANGAVERLGQAADPDALAIAVINLGGALANERRFEEALEVYDRLIDELASPQLPVPRGRRILAISNKVEALRGLGEEDAALELYTDMLERYGAEVPQAFGDAAARNAYDETAKAVVAGLLLKQALALGDLDRKAEALATVNHLVERFESEPGDEFARMLEIAREFQKQLLDET